MTTTTKGDVAAAAYAAYAAYAADDAARASSLRRSAELVREFIPWSEVSARLEAL